MEKIDITPISAAEAAKRYAGIKALNGIDESAKEIADRCTNFEITSANGRGAFGLKRNGSTCWIDIAAGQGSDLYTTAGLGFVEHAAKDARCEFVSFQTARRGLVKKAENHGYEIIGYTLRKRIMKDAT